MGTGWSWCCYLSQARMNLSKTLNCHISPWPGSPRSMKQPYANAGMLLSQGGDPTASTAPRGADPTSATLTNPAHPTSASRGAAWQPGQCLQWVCSRVKSNVSTKASSSQPVELSCLCFLSPDFIPHPKRSDTVLALAQRGYHRLPLRQRWGSSKSRI